MTRDRIAEVVLGLSAIVFTFVLAACPHPPPGPVTPHLRDAAVLYPTCTVPDGGVAPLYTDVCDYEVTPDRRACVRCPSNRGCLLLPDKVYCVSGSCSDDTLCRTDVTAPRDYGSRSGAPSGR